MFRLFRLVLLGIIILIGLTGTAQTGWWRGSIHRSDEKEIVFLFEWKKEKGKDHWVIHNASEKLSVTNIIRIGDSLLVEMPVFESKFFLVQHNNRLEGIWTKGSSSKTVVLPFTAIPGTRRFPVPKPGKVNVAGRWDLVFATNTGPDSSVAELKQDGNRVTGTILNATGDYRFLEGVITGDSILLSTFDGSHAMLFTGQISNKKQITGGNYYSVGNQPKTWAASRNPNAKVNGSESAMYLREGEERLNFTFPDLDGKLVSINDEQFRNEVVIVQLMGSWCPNCMDEMAFLSDYYDRNRHRGVAIVALAFEYSTDWNRSVNSLRKFQKRFRVNYPMLITGVALNDSLRTEKTLPQLTPIRFFPSSVIIDKQGRVRKLDTSFNGPATGKHYEEYKKEFEETVEALLKEK